MWRIFAPVHLGVNFSHYYYIYIYSSSINFILSNGNFRKPTVIRHEILIRKEIKKYLEINKTNSVIYEFCLFLITSIMEHQNHGVSNT